MIFCSKRASRSRQFGTLIALLTAGSAPAFAQSGSEQSSVAIPAGVPETLVDAVHKAYLNNPSLLAAEADSRASSEVVAQAKAQFGPSISASASYGYTRSQIVTPLDTAAIGGWALNYDFSVSQPIFTSGRLTGQLEQALAGESSAREQARVTEMTLMSNVIRAYAGVLRDQRLVVIAEQNVKLLGGQVTETKARYDARYATSTDLNQTQTRLSFYRAQLESAQGNLLASRNFYRNLVGQYPGNLAPLPSLPGLPGDVEAAQQIADLNNPSLRILRLTERGSRAAIAVARAERGPTVSLIGSASRAPYSITDYSTHLLTQTGAVRVTMPLYASGQITARVRETIARNDADNQRIEQQAREVREGVASAWDQLSATRRAIPSYQEAVLAAQRAFEGAQKQETAGQITSLDVLVTAQDLLNAQTSEAQAEAQLYVLHANLLTGMGVLDIHSLDATTPVRNPADYRATFFAGLPTAPIVRPVDSLLYMPQPKHGPVQTEHDTEAGHFMSPEPKLKNKGDTTSN
jgi:outer membrane protein